MEIIKPSYQIMSNLDENESLKMLQLIESAGRVCYKSEAKNADLDPEVTAKFVKGLIKKGHESVIEHEKITVKFIVDRGVSHELVRHRICSFSQESTRYCNYNKKGMQFILPLWCSEKLLGHHTYEFHGDTGDLEFNMDIVNYVILPASDKAWLHSMAEAADTYTSLVGVEPKWSPQQARSVLPNSLKTEIVVTANLRQWREIFRQRCANAAHPQMREIMFPLLGELRQKLPVIFGDLFEESFGMERA